MRIVILLVVVILATTVSEVTGNWKKHNTKCGICPTPCCCKCEAKNISCLNDTTPDCGCVDIIFIVDSSGSIGDFAWQIINGFLVDIVNEIEDQYMDCDNEVHVAPITFGTNATLHWGIHDQVNYDHDQLIDDLLHIPQDKGQSNLVEGLELALTVIGESRPECPCITVLLTDGIPTYRHGELTDMGQAVQDACDLVFCVKVTTPNNEFNLQKVCKPENVVDVLGFDQLKETSLNFLMNAMPTKQPCDVVEEKCSCCCPHPHIRAHNRYW